MIDLLTHGRWVQLVFSRVKILGGQPDDLGGAGQSLDIDPDGSFCDCYCIDC